YWGKVPSSKFPSAKPEVPLPAWHLELGVWHFCLLLLQRFHDAFGDQLDQRFLIERAVGRRSSSLRGRAHRRRCVKGFALDARFLPAMAENVVRADIAVFVLRRVARIGPAPLLLEVEQF